jgi:hypothetical protein
MFWAAQANLNGSDWAHQTVAGQDRAIVFGGWWQQGAQSQACIQGSECPIGSKRCGLGL